MSENTIDSENVSKPAPDTAKPKGAQSQEGEAREERWRYCMEVVVVARK